MSTQKYYGLMTDYGLSRLRAATQGLNALTLSHMAFGDGNGQEIAPTGTMTALVNERYRAPIADKRPHETNPSILYVEAIIPPGIGGWTLREAGIYDSEGGLVAIAKTPVMDVALLAEGATTEGLVRLPIVFESAQAVEFFIDPTVLLATQAWVIDRIIHRPFITVESVTLKAPPASPADFALYVVPTAATGAWAGKDGQMAHWHGAWQFANAPIAKVVGASDTGKYWRRTATGWVEFVGDETTPGFVQFATDAQHKDGTRKDWATHPAGTAANVQAGTWNYATAAGTANALTVALNPAPSALRAGMVINVAISKTSTGAATINVNGLGAVPIKQLDGSSLVAGDLIAGSVQQFVYTGVNFLLLTTQSRTVLGQATTFYVNGATGNDNNDGLTAGTAFRTIQGGIDKVASSYDSAGHPVTLQCAAGTSAPFKVENIQNVQFSIVGASPASTTIAAPVGVSAVYVAGGASVSIQDFTISGPASGNGVASIFATNSASVAFSNITFGPAVTHLYAQSFSSISNYGNYTIAGGGSYHAFTNANGQINLVGATVTLTGTPAFGGAFVSANSGAIISSGMVFSGSATGTRYYGVALGMINSNGGGGNYFPGSGGGAVGSGAVYV